MAQTESYQIVITSPAQKRYQEEILDYLTAHFSIERAVEIDEAIFKTAAKLASQPFRGTREPQLSHFKEDFRFILHKESRIFELKIIYFVQEENQMVYITDFFPTKMNPVKMVST